MTTTLNPSLTLEDFLKQPETEPASEFIDGKIYQKPMPQGKHSPGWFQETLSMETFRGARWSVSLSNCLRP